MVVVVVSLSNVELLFNVGGFSISIRAIVSFLDPSHREEGSGRVTISELFLIPNRLLHSTWTTRLSQDVQTLPPRAMGLGTRLSGLYQPHGIMLIMILSGWSRYLFQGDQLGGLV